MLRIPSVAARAFAAAASIAVAVSVLGGCATRSGLGATTEPTPDPSSASPTASPEATASPDPDATPPPPPAGDAPAAGEGTTVVVITLEVVNGTLEASGMLPDVVEEGGECTLTLSRDAETRTVRGTTAVGPESTYCSLLTLPASQLGSGEWDARLSYRSATHEGVSAVMKVDVP